MMMELYTQIDQVCSEKPLLTMGIAGEIAYEKTEETGTGSFRTALHDAVSRMRADTLKRRIRFYEA